MLHKNHRLFFMIYLFSLERLIYRDKEKKILQFAGSLPKWLPQLELS